MKLENVTYVVNVRNKPPSPLSTTIIISITLYFRIHNAQVAPTSQRRFLFVDKFYLAVTSIAINVSSNFISNRGPHLRIPSNSSPRFFTPARNHSRISIRRRLFMFLLAAYDSPPSRSKYSFLLASCNQFPFANPLTCTNLFFSSTYRRENRT